MLRFKAKYTMKNKTSVQFMLTKYKQNIFFLRYVLNHSFIKMMFGALSNLENNLLLIFY